MFFTYTNPCVRDIELDFIEQTEPKFNLPFASELNRITYQIFQRLEKLISVSNNYDLFIINFRVVFQNYIFFISNGFKSDV